MAFLPTDCEKKQGTRRQRYGWLAYTLQKVLQQEPEVQQLQPRHLRGGAPPPIIRHSPYTVFTLTLSINSIKVSWPVGSLEQNVVELVIVKHVDVQPRLLEDLAHESKAAREVFLGDVLQTSAAGECTSEAAV